MINDIIQLLGVASPQLSLAWTANAANTPGYVNNFALACPAGDTFVAPCNGFANTDTGLDKIILPNGTIPASGVILKIDPQVYLRITRMYASQLESQPAANTVVAERPVPCYFVYTGLPAGTKVNGLFLAGSNLTIGGQMTVHDEHGFPIDPRAVADAFRFFILQFATMGHKAINSAPLPLPTATPQLISIVGGAGQSTIHLISPNGAPYVSGVTDFNGLNAVAAAPGYYLTGTGTITKTNAGPFVKIGAATNGTLGDSYAIRPKNNQIKYDFLRAYVVAIDTHLVGNPNDAAKVIGAGPVVADNEQITLLVNGNECLGAVNNITGPARPLTLVVSPVIDNDFVLPPMAVGTRNEGWPLFPALVPVPGAPPPLPIPADIKNNITVTARYITDPATKDADVLVTISCPLFVVGDSLRIYNRLFNAVNGKESRGAGAGAIISSFNNGAPGNITGAMFRLKDPFGQVNGVGQVTPVNKPKLMLDMVLVNRGLFKRTFGNIQCKKIDNKAALSAQETALLIPGTVLNPGNNLNQMAERGISPAGISGTSSTAIKGATTIGGTILDEIGENKPRNASRYPTMARYDSMAAAFTPAGAAGSWNAFCGGTIFSKEALNNLPLMGNPGSPGGVEYSSVGVHTQGGVLAYEIARAAYRRTRNVFERAVNFAFTGMANSWNPPAAPVAGALNTWAAATLQTIAPHCETPELGLLDPALMQGNWNTLVVKLQQNTVGNPLPAWIPAPLQPRIQGAINGVGTDPQCQRGYAELQREQTSSLYGRQDTYWSLHNAISNAQECVYIQGSFLNNTSYPGDSTSGNPDNDILFRLSDMIQKRPRLKVIICMGKKIHYGKGYESFEAREYKKRMEAVAFLQGPSIGNVPQFADRVIAFHPCGFPMRDKVLQHQVVIVDDMWALVGSSTFRRRGMQFDGSQDVVLFDKKIVNGKSEGIRNFRIRLMKEHLNLELGAVLIPALSVRLNDLNNTFYALKELLDSGGAGLITAVTGLEDQSILLPTDDVADPDGITFSAAEQALNGILIGLSTTPA